MPSGLQQRLSLRPLAPLMIELIPELSEQQSVHLLPLAPSWLSRMLIFRALSLQQAPELPFLWQPSPQP